MVRDPSGEVNLFVPKIVAFVLQNYTPRLCGRTIIMYFCVAEVHVESVCRASDAGVTSDIHVFGSRSHTHDLGTVMTSYTYNKDVSVAPLIELICKMVNSC